MGVEHKKAAQRQTIISGRVRLELLSGIVPVTSILVLVKEKIFVAWVVGPQVFDALVDLTVLLNLLEILDYFERGARALCIVNELILGCGPRSVLELGG